MRRTATGLNVFAGQVKELVYQGESSLLYVSWPTVSRSRSASLPAARKVPPPPGAPITLGLAPATLSSCPPRRPDADGLVIGCDSRRDQAARTGRPQRRRAPSAGARRSSGCWAAWRVPGLLLIAIVALAPIVWLFWLSFRDADGMTLAHYARLLHPSYSADACAAPSSCRSSSPSSASLLGYPLAYVIAQARPASPRSCCCSSCSRSGPRCWCAATPGLSCCSGAALSTLALRPGR